MGQHWHNLSLDTTNILNPQFIFPEPDLTPFMDNKFRFFIKMYEPQILLSQSIIKRFEDISLPLELGVLFFRPYDTPDDNEVHIDIYYKDNTKLGEFAINILLQTKEQNIMRWHEITKEGHDNRSTYDVKHTKEGSPYKNWDIINSKIIDQCTMNNQKFTLVNTAVPHSIGQHQHPRWCLSLRPHKSWTVRFEEAAETYFKDLII